MKSKLISCKCLRVFKFSARCFRPASVRRKHLSLLYDIHKSIKFLYPPKSSRRLFKCLSPLINLPICLRFLLIPSLYLDNNVNILVKNETSTVSNWWITSVIHLWFYWFWSGVWKLRWWSFLSPNFLSDHLSISMH